MFWSTTFSSINKCLREVSVTLASSCQICKIKVFEKCIPDTIDINNWLSKIVHPQLIRNRTPLICWKAGGCGHRIFLPKSSAPRVQFLQVILTKLYQMRINALLARPGYKYICLVEARCSYLYFRVNDCMYCYWLVSWDSRWSCVDAFWNSIICTQIDYLHAHNSHDLYRLN